MSVVSKVIFRLYARVWDSSPKRQQRQQKPDSTDRKQTHYISNTPVQSETGYYNEQGNWAAELPRPVIQTVHLVSAGQKGSCHSRHSGHSSRGWSRYIPHSRNDTISNFFQRNKQDVRLFRKADFSMQPIRQNSTDSSSSSILQVFQFQVFQFQVFNFREVPEFFQRKGEIVLQLPIKENQFQHFCKQLSVGDIFLCRDLLEKEFYGK